MKKIFYLLFFYTIITTNAFSQEIALLQYSGGGDWYANPTSLPNLVAFCNTTIATNIKKKPVTITANSSELSNYPFVHVTGHGNIIFTTEERYNLKNYLEAGGFLHIDDNYGMDSYIRKEIKQIFPNRKLVELPKNHTLFTTPFYFSEGLPKIHEHDNKPPQAFGIFIKNRLVLLYTYESDLGDGWEDTEVHNNPAEVRQKALKMGANIIHYAFTN